MRKFLNQRIPYDWDPSTIANSYSNIGPLESIRCLIDGD
jgi:hypothetical protein